MPLDMPIQQPWQVHLLHKSQQYSHIPYHLRMGLDLLFHLPLLSVFSGHIITQRPTSTQISSLLFSLPRLFADFPSPRTKVPIQFLPFVLSPFLCYHENSILSPYTLLLASLSRKIKKSASLFLE